MDWADFGLRQRRSVQNEVDVLPNRSAPFSRPSEGRIPGFFGGPSRSDAVCLPSLPDGRPHEPAPPRARPGRIARAAAERSNLPAGTPVSDFVRKQEQSFGSSRRTGSDNVGTSLLAPRRRPTNLPQTEFICVFPSTAVFQRSRRPGSRLPSSMLRLRNPGRRTHASAPARPGALPGKNRRDDAAAANAQC